MSLGKVSITEITDRIILHRFVGTGFNEGNLICIEMNDGLIFVDGGKNIHLAKQFRKQMEEKFQKKAKFFVLTHTHSDHLYGMGAFRGVVAIMAKPGVEALAEMHEAKLDTREGMQAQLDQIVAIFKKRNPVWLDDYINEYVPTQLDAEWFDPQILVEDSMVITDGEHEIEISVVGGHSPCSLVLYDKTSKIMLTGDNLNSEHADNGPCMLKRAYLGIELMEEWLTKDIAKFVPGHGKAVDKAYLQIAMDYFKSLHDSLKQLKKEHIPEEDIFEHPSIPAFYEEKSPAFLNRILSIWYDQIQVQN